MRHLHPAIGPLLLLCLVVAGCGGNGGDSDGSTDTTTVPTSRAAGESTSQPTGEPTEKTTTPADPDLDAALAAVEDIGVAAVVAISRDGGPVRVSEFGAFRDDGIEPSETLVDIGSITKTVTGVLLARAVDDGVIDLDDTLGELLPSTPPEKSGITVLQLVTHDAGFPDAIGNDAEHLSRNGYLTRALATPLEGVPGDGYAYSNTGFAVLAAVLEIRTGRSYDEQLQDLLADTDVGDLGYDTVYDRDRSAASSDGRSIRDASWGGHEASWNLIGNGGLVAVPGAIVRLRQAVISGELLSPEMTAAVDRPYLREGPRARSSYGFGLVVDELPGGGPFYWHDGGNGAFSAFWGDLPGQGDVVFVGVANSDAGDASAVIEALAVHLWGLGEQ
ncbi:MAG: serine hydrolase domain-containing protein [Nocardioides sp.]